MPPTLKSSESAAVPVLPRRRLGASSKIGVALGSGASRGLAHIGVMRAFEEQGLQVSFVAGTSMGAFIGSVFAAGNLQSLGTDLLAFDWRRVAGLLDPVFPRSGLIDGQKVAAFLSDYTSRRRIEDLPVKFRAVATDLLTGAEAVLDCGDVTEAVRASIAVPGLLTPVRCNGRILLDGGLVNPVPVSVVRAMGADVVIGVDVSIDVIESRLARIHESSTVRPAGAAAARLHEVLRAMNNPAAMQLDAWLHRAPMPGILDVLMSAIYVMQAKIAKANLERHSPDLLIRPSLGSIRFMDFDRAGEIIELGYQAAKRALVAWVG
jgi:NTE family protein